MLDGDDGFGRRKLVQRTAAERAAILAESYAAVATVAGVAARHGIQPSQLYAWRIAARKKAVSKDTMAEQPLVFAEVAVIPEPLHSSHDEIESERASRISLFLRVAELSRTSGIQTLAWVEICSLLCLARLNPIAQAANDCSPPHLDGYVAAPGPAKFLNGKPLSEDYSIKATDAAVPMNDRAEAGGRLTKLLESNT